MQNTSPKFEPQLASDRMRETSEYAYLQIKEEGLLSKMRLQVYEYLYFNGPATGTEINLDMRGIEGRDNYHKRLSELRDLGVVKEVGKRKCRVTGRQAIEWDVTNELPEKSKPRTVKPRDEHLREALADMRRCWKEHIDTGTSLSSGTVATMRWIAELVRCETCGGAGRVDLGGFYDSCPNCTGKR